MRSLATGAGQRIGSGNGQCDSKRLLVDELAGSRTRERRNHEREKRKKAGKKKERKTSFKIKFLQNYDFATDFFELQLSHHNFDLGEPHVHELLLMSFMHLSVAKSQLKKKPQKSQKF